jgi:tetratricopeptide (TPR) repeat protein/2-polyprenyl-3-methyl-5-hydroxy-6-metoxy-1,4-benzoquinol methylase
LKSIGIEKALRLAKRNSKEGKLSEAKQIYQDILDKFPKNKVAIKGLHDLTKTEGSNAKNSREPQANTINSLINLKSQGQYQRLKSETTRLLSSYPRSIALYDLMGTANYGLGKYQDSVDAYKRALALLPNSPVLHYNLGNSLKEQGNLKEAVISYEKALPIQSNSVEIFLNMARTFHEKESYKNAVKAYHKALSINPNLSCAYNDMGVILELQGDLDKAIDAYCGALIKDPNNVDANYNLAAVLKGGQFQTANPGLHSIVKSILDKKTIVRPSDISDASLSLLKLDPAVKMLTRQNSKGTLGSTFEEVILGLSDLPLLLKLMSICPIADVELESALTNIRSHILTSLFKDSNSNEILTFQSALALQCFTNEYIYTQNSEDSNLLQKLEALIELDFSKGKQPNTKTILCLASFKSLGEYKWRDLIDVTKDLEDVFIRQVLEPKEEQHLRQEIKTLGSITDGVSSKVRKQYEESPYPRWVNLGLTKKATSIQEMVDKNRLKLSNPNINKVPEPCILIAGCGTGQHSIGTAARFKDSKVIAVDLSLSSLAYAERKTKELGIQNIEYMQADLLNLRKLNIKFDIIESMGVLHHLGDPMEGWRVLTECLKSDGLMKIGLYSEIARKPIVKIRRNISTSKRPLSDEKILSIRKKIISSKEKEYELIKCWRDFYSLSELRDLIFHVKEHQFTLPQLKTCLKKLRLKFCGFESHQIQSAFLKVNDDSNLYDLEEWNNFETSNPEIFAGMYQFWCQKS